MTIDSQSVGDPGRFLGFESLASGLSSLAPSPADEGRVALIVTRSTGGVRQVHDSIRLSIDGGIPGDAWGRGEDRSIDAQLAIMQTGVAQLIANGQSLLLFGDNLFLDLDLSSGNLPVGSVVRAGDATLTVTVKPHNGCSKFRARFGLDAVRFVSDPQIRGLNLRGIYMRVIEDGKVAVGDPVRVIQRG